MRLMLASLSEAEMRQLAGTLGERGYPGGTQALAAEARSWIAAGQWADLEDEDIRDMADGQALSGIARKHEGGLDAFHHRLRLPARQPLLKAQPGAAGSRARPAQPDRQEN
jgi:hypothetical protein